MNYLILRDTREKDKKGWTFSKQRSCLGTEVRKLDYGDYSIDGLQHSLTIERKGGVAEFAHNVIEDRFIRELEELNKFKYAFIILEFELADLLLYPYGCLPKHIARRCKYSGKFVLKKLTEFFLQFPNIRILFCGSKGKEMASAIFKEISARYGEAN